MLLSALRTSELSRHHAGTSSKEHTDRSVASAQAWAQEAGAAALANEEGRGHKARDPYKFGDRTISAFR